ncbi:lysophospholipid acyltransferase family protein [Reinekea sp.]|jgi:putative hemolysin|uniref:lysophospholipid acyltransferase family protein n=1 Tax=Reinekea sp. TaxID=1970455 RepID=UPI00398A48FC
MELYNPFRLSLKHGFVNSALERLLGLTPLIKAYDACQRSLSAEAFLDYTLKALETKVVLKGQPLVNELPETGATIVVANHPLGGLEGVALTRALLSVRPDTKVLTNQMLSGIPELSENFLGVDVLGKKTAHRNTSGVRAADEHLAQGGVLLVFPAGQVSANKWRNLTVQDRQWNYMVGRLALKHKASCLPVFIHGKNPNYFYLAGLIHRRLRTVLLPRQLTNKTGMSLTMTVGTHISHKEAEKAKTATALTHLLRMSTYFLAPSSTKAHRPLEILVSETGLLNRDALLIDIANLEQYKVLNKGEFNVYCAPFHALGSVFSALAEAREITFRAAGEGTGKQFDTDQYDKYYLHLFVWDEKNNAIVGGYRLGETDKIIAQRGVTALYSRSLYKFDQNYMAKFGNALEVGRSFVTQAYQRHPYALDLLWRGIGSFVANNPKYSRLFGCVSISSDHSDMARAFISDAMMEGFRAEQKFLENVKPIAPLKVKNKIWTPSMLSAIRDISVFNKLVGQCEPGKSIPVLLRHYIALNGKFVGFSINKGFNDSLDGLIMVDLQQMPERYLNRYLTKNGAAKFKQHWIDHEATY